MAQTSQPLDAHPALILGFGREPVQPIEHGNGLRVLLVEDNSNLGHDAFPACSHYCEQWSRGQDKVRCFLFAIRLDPKVLGWLRRTAQKKGLPYQSLVNQILAEEMRKAS